MIFAKFQYLKHYSEIHSELVSYLKEKFSKIEHGHQGDSWIWVFDSNNEKVQIDTFTSMQHEIKCNNPGDFVRIIIQYLANKYELEVFETPELEDHED